MVTRSNIERKASEPFGFCPDCNQEISTHKHRCPGTPTNPPAHSEACSYWAIGFGGEHGPCVCGALKSVSRGRCDGCVHWDFRDPEDMGVCTHADGPGDGTGFAIAVERAALSRDIKAKHAGRMATTCDSRCDRFQVRA
jgi:hypothetical protein